MTTGLQTPKAGVDAYKTVDYVAPSEYDCDAVNSFLHTSQCCQLRLGYPYTRPSRGMQLYDSGPWMSIWANQ